ncbi:MAG: xanthine dehydrogenase family protein [Bacillati bacterium ANGP1]|uniref:Xanthine dehydrogenase family protein n=1 Tax=Candidatus Segetimicrobium genomatis TaxID=2569760 RepID=A0A537JC13_9BACT|nr:MAG: xanthine dehydrogenase family protein [Terrabacteria group bacterium ANGP1]
MARRTPDEHPDPFRIVGRPLPRFDVADKVQGTTLYAADWRLPGMLAGRILRAVYPSARIRRISVEHARGLPGVAAVLTADDVPQNALHEDPTGLGLSSFATPVLAADRVRYQGEPVALVAAESEVAAQAALEAIEVEYEPLPGVFDAGAALAPDAPRVHPDRVNLLIHWKLRQGDVEAGFRRSDAVVERTYRTQRVDHAALEPEAAVAWVDGDGVVTIRAATQVIEHFREIAEILRLPHNKVRVMAPFLGGGFGGKEDMTVEPYVALLAWKTRRPVRMLWTRQESLLARPKRHPFTMSYKTGATRDGRLVAQEISLLADAGPYPLLSPRVVFAALVVGCGPYRVPNVKIDARAVFTNNVPTSAMRGFGAMQVTFAYESQMDLLAEQLGMSALEIRSRNFLQKGDRLPTGEALETEAALPHITARAVDALGERSRPSAPSGRVGRGIACNMQPYGRTVWFRDRAQAWIGFEADGALVIRAGITDLGGGQAASLAQLAAEVLGVSPDRIAVHIGDSALTPLAGGTFATRQLYMSGNAVVKAAGELRAMMIPVAASLLEAAEPDVQFADNHAGVIGAPERTIALARVVAECARRGIPTSLLSGFQGEHAAPIDLETGQGRTFPDYTFGCHAVEVEVDAETGTVRVLKLAACHDVGRAINPQSVEGQIQGGAVMGAGQALMEEVAVEAGINLTTLFAGYLIPTAMDMPDVRALVVESGEGKGPFSARGIGEPPTGPPPAAVAAAIQDAVGVRLMELPMTPERVFDAVRARPARPKNEARGKV